MAIIIYACLFTFVGKQISLPIVDTVSENSAAERAGFIPNDLIVSIDGSPVESFNDVARTVSVNPERDLVFVVVRNDVERCPRRSRVSRTRARHTRAGNPAHARPSSTSCSCSTGAAQC